MIDLSAAVMLDVAVDMLTDSNIIVETVEVINLEFIVEVADTVEVLVCVWAGAIVGSAPVIGAETNENSFATVMGALRFALLSALEEPFLCC